MKQWLKDSIGVEAVKEIKVRQPSLCLVLSVVSAVAADSPGLPSSLRA